MKSPIFIIISSTPMDDAGSERSYLIECNTGFHKKRRKFSESLEVFFSNILFHQKFQDFFFNYEKACVFWGKLFFDHID